MSVYGIDLGTTYSCIARIDGSGMPVVIRNAVGDEATPSAVFFENEYHVVVGSEAKNAALAEPESVVLRIKREMGKSGVELDFHGTTFTPEAISALILRDLVRSTEADTGVEVKDVVITVPAYFGVAEREATRTAGAMAGLNVVNVVPEPVAAALYYGVLNAGVDRDVLVFDLGGGTFDTTVIRLVGEEVTVVCTDGHHELGGADWDDKLVDYLREQFMVQFPDSGADEDEAFLQDLALCAEDVKKSLSTRQTRRHAMVYHGLRAQVDITRETFEHITAELLELTMEITERTLDEAADRGVTRFDEVLLVGGSTRMPMVAAALVRRFGFQPKMHEPDLAVAKGAALFGLVESLRLWDSTRSTEEPAKDAVTYQQSATKLDVSADLVASVAKKKVTIVVPRAFGIAVLKDDGLDQEPDPDEFRIVHLLTANTALPTEKTREFVTPYDNQREINIEIWEQAGPVASVEPEHNKLIGGVSITRLPPLPKGSAVDVTFRMDEGGMLHVAAQDKTSGQTAGTQITIGDLSTEQINAARQTVARLS